MTDGALERSRADGSTSSSGLARRYGVVTAGTIVVANMVGSGIFTTSGFMASLLPGPGWVIGCWLLGGLIALSGALGYAELATRMPRGGAEYVYLSRLYHPSLGFLTGWTSFIVGFSAPIALSALGLVAYLARGFGLEAGGLDAAATRWPYRAAAILVILAFTGLHYVGGRLGPRVQNGLTAVKVGIVIGIAAAGLAVAPESVPVPTTVLERPFDPLDFGTAMMMVMFAYSGWNGAAYIAGEVRRPRKTLPIALVGGTVVVIGLYLAVNVFIFAVAPWDRLEGVVTVVETAAVEAFGLGFGRVLSLLVGVALFSSLSAFVMIGPRVYHAMAEDGLFFGTAARVHPRFGVPSTAILIQGLVESLLVVLGTFEQLLVYLGFALGLFPWLAVAGLFVARARGVGEARAARVSGYPVVPLFYLVSSLGLMVVAFLNRPFESSAAIVTVGAGWPIYLAWERSRHRSRMAGSERKGKRAGQE